MEQISICVRFVHRKDEDNTVEVREEFLGFVEAESTKGVALAEKFMTTQAEFGIETCKMRAEGTMVRQIWPEYTGVCKQS